MKICNKCNIKKQMIDFHSGRGSCKECRKLQQNAYNLKPEIKNKRNKQQKQWYLENKEKSKQYQKAYYKGNKSYHNKHMEEYHAKPEIIEKRKIYAKKYYEANIDKIKAKSAKRRAIQLKATLPGFEEEIRHIYKNCPKGYHVDHIIPLCGKDIRGLHVPWNLQYLPARENLRKSNKWDS